MYIYIYIYTMLCLKQPKAFPYKHKSIPSAQDVFLHCPKVSSYNQVQCEEHVQKRLEINELQLETMNYCLYISLTTRSLWTISLVS